MSTAFVVRNSPWKLLAMLLGSACFVAGGLWMVGVFGPAPNPEKAWAGWVSILFFGLCGTAALHRLLDRRDQIIIGDEGVFYRGWSDQEIPWKAIRWVEESEVRVGRSKHRMLGLWLHEPSAYPSTTTLGRVARLQASEKYGDVTISMGGLDRTPDEIASAIHERRKVSIGAVLDAGAIA